MTIEEMTDEIRSKINIPDIFFITDIEILAALNDGYKEVSVKALCIENTETITTVVGERYYQFTGIKINEAVFEYDTASGNYPKYWFQWGQYLVIEPIPDDTFDIVVYSSTFPDTAMNADEIIVGDLTDTPQYLPLEFQPCIKDFAYYVLYLKLKKWKQTARYYNIYIGNLKKRYKEYMERKAEKRAIHRIPDNVIYSGGQPWAH